MRPAVIYDISPQINEASSTWPGDEHMHRRQVSNVRSGEPFNIFTLRSNGHLGAHVDAPSFLNKDQKSIDQLHLESFLGPCQLIRLQAEKKRPLLLSQLRDVAIESSRILIDTGTFNGERAFAIDFAHLTPEIIDYLFEQGVRTIGIDAPSIDAFATKEWSCHKSCFVKEIAVIEGLLLWKVPAGQYELIALPLKLEGFDASPIRAVLRTLPQQIDDFTKT